MMLSQPRVLLAMARDGMVPESFFGAVHQKFRTPWKSTILTGLFVGAMATLLPLRILAELTNIGTLLAFVIVCAAVLIMRKTNPKRRTSIPRPVCAFHTNCWYCMLFNLDVFFTGRKLVAFVYMAGNWIHYLF